MLMASIKSIYKGMTPVDQIYKGKRLVWAQGIPPIYQQVEYIESTGAEYIMLDYKAKPNVAYTIVWQLTSTQGTQSVFGVVDSKVNIGVTYVQAIFACKKNGLDISDVPPKSVTLLAKSSCVLTDERIEFTNGYENHTWTNSSRQTEASDDNLIMFARRRNGDITNYAKTRIYSFCSDEFNCIPCYRKSDGVIGLYDTNGRKFYTNQGQGAFLKGPDVSQ